MSDSAPPSLAVRAASTTGRQANSPPPRGSDRPNKAPLTSPGRGSTLQTPDLGGSSRAAAFYERVSTGDQDLSGQDRELREFARSRGWSVARVYAEKVTGTGRMERKQYDRLLTEAQGPNRSWSRVVVWSLDRFSREERFTKAIDAILDLEKLGISFHSFKEPYLDTPTEAPGAFDVRGLLLSVTTLVASFESRRRSERIALAMAEIRSGRRATRSGRPPGRQPRLTAEIVASIVQMRRQEPPVPYGLVAQKLSIPSGTARRAFSLAQRGLRAFVTPSVRKVPLPEGPGPRSLPNPSEQPPEEGDAS